MVDASHEKEARAKETIAQLKTEISNLSRLVEQGAGLSVGQENTVNELLHEKEELAAERDQQLAQISDLRSDTAVYLAKLCAKETERLSASQDIQSLKDSISSKKAEQEREERRRERLDKEAKDLRTVLELRAAELKARNVQLSSANEKGDKLEDALRVQNFSTEKALLELETMKERMVKAEGGLKDQLSANAEKVAENVIRQAELMKTDQEIAKVRQVTQSSSKQKETQQKRLNMLDQERAELNRDHETLKTQAASLEREIDIEKRETATAKKQATELQQELEDLRKALENAADSTQRQVAISKLNSSMIKTLEADVGSYKQESARHRKILYQLEKEREKFGSEASSANAKFAAALEEVKLREMTILDLQKKIAESDARLKQQQHLYEAVRSDRNQYSKSLIESQDEIAEMKRKFKIMNHQIEQLKEEIQAKDQAYVKERIEHTKSEKEKDTLKNELIRIKKQVAIAEASMKNFEAEVSKLNHIITDADVEHLRQKREYDIVINERDILGTQLIRRNDELALLYEKIKIQQASISQGEIGYRDRIEDLRVLKLRANALRRELHIQRAESTDLDLLRSEVYGLQRELLQDRTKVKALSEELENPNNSHRWRKLDGSDPGTHEMIQKIQALQKRLIAKTEEVVERDLLIQEKDKLYVELKNILARQPGPEIAEQLSLYQQGVRNRTKSMRATASELNMYQAQVNEYKFELERLTRELQEVKRQYYEQKRRETLHKAYKERR